MTAVSTQTAPSGPVASASPPPPPRSRPGLNTETVALGALFFAVFASIASLIAVGFGVRAIQEAKAGGGGTGGVAPVAPEGTEEAGVPVTLTEWEINPNVDVEAGATLRVTNEGTQDHNYVVLGTNERTSLIKAGSSQGLRLDGLAPGTYKVICSVAGHESSGMQSELTVRPAGAGGEPASQTEATEHAASHSGG